MVEAPTPFFPGEFVAFAGRIRGAQFGIGAIQLDMPQLCIRQQMTIGKQRRSQAGANCNHQDYTIATAARAKAHLRQASGIGVVNHADRATGQLRKQRGCIKTNPFFMNVRSRQGDALAYNRWETAANRLAGAVPIKVTSNLGNRFGHSTRFRRLWSWHTVPGSQQKPGVNIYRCAFDPRAANVNTQNFHFFCSNNRFMEINHRVRLLTCKITRLGKIISLFSRLVIS